MKLEGKRVLLTGATGGLGEAMARQLAAAGARLILTGRNQEKLQALKQQLAGGPHTTVVVDLHNAGQRQRLVDAVSETGIDILLNNAGINYLQLFADAPEEDVALQLEMNLLVPMQLTRALLPVLQAQPEALIINVGSILGSIGFAGSVAYSASKFGLRGFSEALRRELADTTVGVLYFAPRATATPIHTDRMVQMNESLGTSVDKPDYVAQQLLRCIAGKRPHNHYLGWPEKLFVRLNGLLPTLVDKSLFKQLPVIKQFAGQ
ncbi:SDR family oxidoreductase [Pseudomaricurvus sp. HS19]|uniref:SDR family oxidoreductase n=1 Tax=Pseudomaricurvus sp. HS19 TaxID=2692626 RepID=UPI00136BC0F3|nr:SDR family oxidoreductase [Pseudomaricurvus sp. HS19]